MDYISRILALFRPRKAREGAACYSHDDSLFLCAINEIRDGPGVHWKPFCRLSSDEPEDELGRSLTRILDGSGRILDLDDPADFEVARKEQLRAAGFSSERDLQTRATMCHVARNRDSIIFTPTRNGGTRGDGKGFRDLEAAAMTVALPASDSVLGAALLATLRKCT